MKPFQRCRRNELEMKIARQAREDEEGRPRLPWLGLLLVSLVEHALPPDSAPKAWIYGREP